MTKSSDGALGGRVAGATPRLSEAIRLGAMLRPQGWGFMFHGGTSCAWGAAVEAAGWKYTEGQKRPDRDQFARWQWGERDVPCPQCGSVLDVHGIMGGHLNDTHRWTRERIADWVATIEPQAITPPGVAESFTERSEVQA